MAADFDEPMFGDEPVFDDAFVRGATFTEPSARERARPPSGRERRRMRRAAKRARRTGGPRLRRRRRNRDPSHRAAVLKLIGAVLVLFAISFALWWWNSAPRDPEPVRPVVPTAPNSPAPAPSTELPSEIPEI